MKGVQQSFLISDRLAAQLIDCCLVLESMCEHRGPLVSTIVAGVQIAMRQTQIHPQLDEFDDLDVAEAELIKLLDLHLSIPIGRLEEETEPHPSAQRMVNLASAIAVEPESADEWQAHLHELASTSSPRDVARFLAGILYASLHSRASWLLRQSAAPGVNLLCWTLRSDARTWTVLAGLLLWAGVETAADTGVGAAILVVLLAFSGLIWVVERLRNRYDAHPPKKATPPQRED